MSRTIKIVPSRSSRGSYFVEPRGFLQVNITIDSQNPFLPIVFKAYDRETQAVVLLNNSESVRLQPRVDKEDVSRVVVTPQGIMQSFCRRYF